MKQFLFKISFYFIPFALWSLYAFYSISNISGDLGALGMIPFGECDSIFDSHKVFNSKLQECYSLEEIKDAEIITIGDSFSEQAIDGYQNRLSKDLNHRIYNLNTNIANSYSPIQVAYSLLYNKQLKNCKVLIVETVERSAIGRLLTYDQNANEIDSTMVASPIITPKIDFNIKSFCSFTRLFIGMDNPVKRLHLSVDLFTHKSYGKTLFFYCDDINFNRLKDADCQEAVNKLLLLKNLADDRGIYMIFMIAADKYDQYYDFINENPYPANPTLNYFSNLDTSWYVNTKQVRLPSIKQGDKDIFKVNNTHWSVIGANIVADHLAEMIIKNNSLNSKSK